MAGKTGVVIPFPAVKGAAPRFRGSGVMADGASKIVDRKGCIGMLDSVVPLPAELAGLLAIPESLYLVGDEPSLSSDASRGVGRVAASLAFNMAMPRDIPDYGIIISSRGSNVFCTLVDRRRKIIVMDSVANAYGGEGSWTSFMQALDDAIGAARRAEAAGERFDFLVNKESTIRTIRL